MELLQRLFYTAMSAASIFYFIVKISLSHWKNRGILHEKPTFLWGNLKGVGKKRHVSRALQEVYEKYKETDAPFVGFYAFIKPMVLTIKLDVIKNMLDNDYEYFGDRGLYRNIEDDPLTGNLVQLDGECCWKMRSKMNVVFCSADLSLIYPRLLDVANTFRQTLLQLQSDQDIFNITDLVDSYNVDIISLLAFGLEGNTLKYSNTEFRAMCKNYYRSRHLFKEYLATTFPSLARLLQYKCYDQAASKYFMQLVENKIEERGWNRIQQKNKDFLDIFAQLRRRRSRKNRITEQQVGAQAFTFVLAGLESCNSTMVFCLYELALQPLLQQKLRAEINQVLRQHNGTITPECVLEMKYLKQVFSETLRKHPPYSFTLRMTTQDYEVPDTIFMLKEGNPVIIPIAAIHHDARIYPEPEKFDPDRFLPEAVQQRHPMAWLPFGGGYRGCVALKFAEMQILVGLITLLRDFKFNPCPLTEIPLAYDSKRLLLSPQSDIKLQLERI